MRHCSRRYNLQLPRAFAKDHGKMNFEPYLTTDTNATIELITNVVAEDAASAPMVDANGLSLLLEAATDLSFRKAREEIHVNENTIVRQDFELCYDIPSDGAFWYYATAMECHLNKALAQMSSPPLVPSLHLNDLVLQRYAAGSQGITPHRDHVRYQSLVVLLVLSGHGRYYICSDREGNGAHEIPAPAGHVILMRAPGFASRKDRPFHFLSDITSERYSFGIRYDAMA